MKDADSNEFTLKTKHPVIYLMKEWYDYRTGKNQVRDEDSEVGGTLRLGAYPCKIHGDTFARKAYGVDDIMERHRHRFEFNNEFRDKLMESGLVISGTSPDSTLVEIVELEEHPWFLGCQFHPEFKSSPMKPHPLFRDFIKAAFEESKK
jgi:CTP synthase